MNSMEDKKDIREFLGRAYRIDRQIASKLNQIQSLNELAKKASITLSDMPGSPSRNIHKTEDVMVKIISLQEEVKEDAKELLEIKAEAMKMIKKVENPEYRLLLEERYLCYYSWETIASDLDCTVRNVQILHGKALNSVIEA